MISMALTGKSLSKNIILMSAFKHCWVDNPGIRYHQPLQQFVVQIITIANYSDNHFLFHPGYSFSLLPSDKSAGSKGLLLHIVYCLR